MSEGTPPPPPSTPPSPSHAEGPPGGGAPRSFVERLTGALKLDAATYEEIEHDPDALSQAAGVIAIVALCSAIGGAAAGGGGIVSGIVTAFLGWLAGTGVVWLIGVKMMGHTSDYPELLRTLGFASAPQMIVILGFIPVLGALAALAGFAWGIAAYVVAVRQALDVETGRAIVVCVLAWLTWVLLGFLLLMLFGGQATVG